MKNRKQAYHIETEKGLINDPNGLSYLKESIMSFSNGILMRQTTLIKYGGKQPLKTLFIGVSLLSHYKLLKLMTRMGRIQEVQSVMVRHYLFIIREM